MSIDKRVSIIGAGPGGLTAAMLLAHRGYKVDIFEIKDQVGGRNGKIEGRGYTFDIGPTFLMMDFILKEIFDATDRKLEDYITIQDVEPMYRLTYRGNDVLKLYRDRELLQKELDSKYKDGFKSYLNFLEQEEIKFNRILPSLQVPYSRFIDMFRKELRNAAPKLDPHISLYEKLGQYFDDEDLKLAFSFQAKYLGMSPWECPGTFSIISFIEHFWGIKHVKGGLNSICKAMATVVKEEGGEIHLNTGVKDLIIKDKKAIGVRLENGKDVYSDYVIMNADFAYGMTNLISQKWRRKYKDEALKNKKYSCSIFMIYLGVNKEYNLNHHNIYFAKDYKTNVDDITKRKILSEEPSFYIQDASKTDKTVSPEGKSALYVLVPVPNNSSKIDWNKERLPFKEKIMDLLESKAGLTDIRSSIEFEHIITPFDWEEKYNVYYGATFNLAHNIAQMLYFRPHNKFEELKNCYLVGGGTHPGSGLPTIYESARISTNLIFEADGVLNIESEVF